MFAQTYQPPPQNLWIVTKPIKVIIMVHIKDKWVLKTLLFFVGTHCAHGDPKPELTPAGSCGRKKGHWQSRRPPRSVRGHDSPPSHRNKAPSLAFATCNPKTTNLLFLFCKEGEVASGILFVLRQYTFLMGKEQAAGTRDCQPLRTLLPLRRFSLKSTSNLLWSWLK